MYKNNYIDLKNKPKLQSILWQVVLPTVSVLILFIISGFFILLPLIRANFISREQAMIKNAIDIAFSTVKYFKSQVDFGTLTEGRAKSMALKNIENFRYGESNKEYFFVLDDHGVMLMHPYATDTVGTNVVDYKDFEGNTLFKDMINIALASDSGYVEYYWQLHGDTYSVAPKMSYVRYYKPWNWIIGTGLYLDGVENKLWVLKKKILFGIIIISLVTGIMCFWIIKYSMRMQKIKFNAESEIYESTVFLKKLIDNIPGIIYTKDLQGKFILTNLSFQDIAGKDEDSIIGKSDDELFGAESAENFVRNDLKVIRTGKVLRCEEKLYYNGVNKTYLSLKFPLKDFNDEIKGVCGVSTDITDIITLQEELKYLNENLEKKVEERTILLDQSNKSLTESLEKLKRAHKELIEQEKMAALGKLVAGVAHEINTPVGIGITALSNLSDRIKYYKDKYSANQLTKLDFNEFMSLSEESVEIVYNNLRRAADLISSFKQIAVDQTIEDFRTFDLKEYLEELIKSLNPKLKKTKHKVHIICKSGFIIFSCPGAISQIFSNLIMNSLLHGFDNIDEGEIFIQVEVVSKHICIKYSDNGKGMERNIVENIFEPFFTTARGKGGSGLGMNLVYNMVTQKLKGEISCESELGKGCCFFIKIPLDSSVHSESNDLNV